MTVDSTPTHPALFDAEPYRIGPAIPEVDDRTHGQRMRDRQAARIAAGLHPLSIRSYIPLHPDAPRDARKGDPRDFPRCGTCINRVIVEHHNRDYPKCLVGFDGRRASTATRSTASDATDVRAWWPACVDYEPPPEGT